MSAIRPLPAALATLGGGVVLLLLSEAEILRVAAAVMLLAGIVLGVFAIVTPEFLAADDE